MSFLKLRIHVSIFYVNKLATSTNQDLLTYSVSEAFLTFENSAVLWFNPESRKFYRHYCILMPIQLKQRQRGYVEATRQIS